MCKDYIYIARGIYIYREGTDTRKYKYLYDCGIAEGNGGRELYVGRGLIMN